MNFLKQATAADDALQMVKTLIIKGGQHTRETPPPVHDSTGHYVTNSTL